LAEVLESDRASPSAGPRLAQQLRDRKLIVNPPVNNAGFGVRAEFLKLLLEREMHMPQLNNAAAVERTYSLLPS
jgi:short-subunit dehydrogenase